MVGTMLESKRLDKEYHKLVTWLNLANWLYLYEVSHNVGEREYGEKAGIAKMLELELEEE